MKHHDGLRLGFERDADGRVYARNHGPDTGLRLDRSDLTHLGPDDQKLYITDVLQKTHASLSLSQPPLFRAVYLLMGKDRLKLGLVSHHLLLDMRSCRILFEDLLTACQQLQHGAPIALPPKTTSVKDWSERLAALAQQNAFSDEVDFWQAQLRARRSPLPFYLDPIGDDVTEADQSRALPAFDERETKALTRDLRTTGNAGADEIVLAGFAEAFRTCSKADNLVFNIFGVGRERVFDGVSLDRTVGEINTVFPLALPLSHGDMLDVVKRTFAAIPAKGLHYPMLRYLIENSEISQLREPDIFSNYVSRIDPSLSGMSDARLVKLPEGVCTSAPENQACYKLYVEASIVAGCLSVTLDYSRKLFNVDNIIVPRRSGPTDLITYGPDDV